MIEAEQPAPNGFGAEQDAILKCFKNFWLILGLGLPLLNHPPLQQPIYPLAQSFFSRGWILTCSFAGALSNHQAQQLLGEKGLAPRPAQHLLEKR